jgi:hypothetical protein
MAMLLSLSEGVTITSGRRAIELKLELVIEQRPFKLL